MKKILVKTRWEKWATLGRGMTVKAGSPTLKKKKSGLQNPCTWGFLRKPYYKDPLEAVIYFLLSVAAINSTHFKERKKKKLKKSWEVPYHISHLVFCCCCFVVCCCFTVTFFFCGFPGFRESKFSCAWICFICSIQLPIRSTRKQKWLIFRSSFIIKGIQNTL